MTMKRLLIGLVALLGLWSPVAAQTTVSSTTLAAAVDSDDTQFQLASTSAVAVGDILGIVYQDRIGEGVIVRAVNSPYVTVSRGAYGVARAWANGATVYNGPPVEFYSGEPAGTCTAGNEAYLPHIVLPGSGRMYQCSPAGTWYALDDVFVVSCWTGALATGSIDQTCWQATSDAVVVAIDYVSTVAESGGTLTVIPRRQESTEAAASGDALATAISGVSTVAQTVTAFTLTATSALLLLDDGDRLGIDFTDDVAGELAGVVVTFQIAPR